MHWPILQPHTADLQASVHRALLASRPLGAMARSLWGSREPIRVLFPPPPRVCWDLVPPSVWPGLFAPWSVSPPALHLETCPTSPAALPRSRRETQEAWAELL